MKSVNDERAIHAILSLVNPANFARSPSTGIYVAPAVKSRKICARRWSWALWAILGAAGCATPELHVESVTVASRRLVALPAEATVYDFDFYNRRTPNEADTAAAKKNLDDSFNYRLRQHGTRAFREDALDSLAHSRVFRGWVVDSLTEILAERLGRGHLKHETVGDWTFASSLGAWRSALDADFVLVSLFVDGRNTPGRMAAVTFVGGWYADPHAIACVVELQRARIVWCNLRGIRKDLLLRGGAQAEVDALLDEMLLAGDAAAVQPPPTGPAPLVRATPADDPGPPPKQAGVRWPGN
jgi:hypothetical protein